MITIEDFTLLPEGSIIAAEGTISRCPACGRGGIVNRPENATPYCIHAEESEVLCDGMLVEPTDRCDLTRA
jgi:predicted metalloprotease